MAEAGADAFHGQPQAVGRAAGQWLEAPAGIPVGGAVVERINDHRADGQVLVSIDDAGHSLFEQPRAEFLASVSFVSGQAGDERGTDLVEADQPAAFTAGQLLDFNRGGDQGDVAGDRAFALRVAGGIVDGDERARQAAPLISHGMLDEPAVQRRLAAGELGDLVAVGQGLETHNPCRG